MTDDEKTMAARIDQLEHRIEELEHRTVTRDLLDRELRSLEQRLNEVREMTEG